MIELSALDPVQGSARLGFAGDTANTAIYLSRLRGGVSYLTNLGVDRLSDQMIDWLRSEGVDGRLIGRHPDRLPGLYAIEVDPAGERSFRYWREASAARTLFDGIGPTLEDLAGFDLIYLSGITLAILPEAVRTRLIAALGRRKQAGGTIVFDSNYRPRLWPDAQAAREAFAAMARVSSVALPSLDDEVRLYPGARIGDVLDRLEAAGVREVVLKNGAEGVTIRSQGRTLALDLPAADAVFDTTGAGDSFNAAYLAARLGGAAPEAAARAGHRLAGAVIRHPGAIIPRAAMPAQGASGDPPAGRP